MVVKPDCIFLGNMYSVASILTFSRRSIKLEGFVVDGTNRSLGFNQPISDIVKINCFWYKEVSCNWSFLDKVSHSGKRIFF